MDTVDRAIVIGEFTSPFEFWTLDGKRQICPRKLFASDEEAEQWFMSTYPNEYRAGAEMRRYE